VWHMPLATPHKYFVGERRREVERFNLERS
jgi:hypothetical protein